MNKGKNKHRFSYTRGTLGNGYLAREYDRFCTTLQDAEPSPAGELLDAYFEYHVSRLVNLYVISGCTDIKSQTTVLTSVVRTAFKIYLTKNEDEVRASKQIKGAGRMSYRHSYTPASSAARLGVAGGCEVGSSMILGISSSEAAGRLDLSITLSAYQLALLREYLHVLGRILEGFERAVPLNLDYRLSFYVRSDDHTFQLPSGKASVASTAVPLLGITTALGTG